MINKAIKRGNAYRIQITINGKRLSCTRDTARECEQWAARKLLEHNASNGEPHKTDNNTTLRDVVTLFLASYSPSKKSHKYNSDSLWLWQRAYPWLFNASIASITPKDLTRWRDQRLDQVQGATVKRNFALLSSVFSYAVKELYLIDVNPCHNVRKPTNNAPRAQRINDADIAKILAACDYTHGQTPTKPMHYVAWGFLFALATAMRRGELLALTQADIHPKYAILHDTKNGTARQVPLQQSARALLELIKHDGAIIPLTANAFKLSWQRALKRAGIDNITFHDTRHEAITRLAKVVPVEILAKISGHKTISVLINTYYNPDINEIADLLN